MEKKYIELVLKEAEKAYNSGEVPVGAVIIKNNKIIAKAHNMVEKKKNSIPIEEYEERLKSIQKDIITNIYEKIKNSNNPIDVIKNDSTIDSNFKSKIILPVIEQISKQNLELNFHNFYLLCSELLVYVNI